MTETTQKARRLEEKTLRDLISEWRQRQDAARQHGRQDREAAAYADVLGDCARDLDRLVAAAFGGQHECSFPCNPPGGTMWAPGPCSICGKTWDRAQAERMLAEAQAAMKAAGGAL